MLDVSLMESSVSLDDVVVVGYGVQKKVNVTGAVSMVKGDELETVPSLMSVRGYKAYCRV